MDLPCRRLRRSLTQRPDIIAVHAQKQVEPFKVPGVHLSRPLHGDIDTEPAGDLDRTWVGRIAHMPGTRSGRIDHEIRIPPALGHHTAKHALGER